eukprot:5978411-Pyramimonas_sp.AAC.1
MRHGIPLHHAALALHRCMKVLNRPPVQIPREVLQQLLDLALCHAEFMKLSGTPLMFKHHFPYA